MKRDAAPAREVRDPASGRLRSHRPGQLRGSAFSGWTRTGAAQTKVRACERFWLRPYAFLLLVPEERSSDRKAAMERREALRAVSFACRRADARRDHYRCALRRSIPSTGRKRRGRPRAVKTTGAKMLVLNAAHLTKMERGMKRSRITFSVVPAKAGTHTRRSKFCRRDARVCVTTASGGYGSPPSRGRQKRH